MKQSLFCNLLCILCLQFFSLMFVLILLQISAIVIAFVFNNDTDRYIRPIAQESIRTNYAVDSAAGHLVSSGWDILQRTVSCETIKYQVNKSAPVKIFKRLSHSF